MSHKYKIRDQDKLYFVTFTVIQWLDVFSRRRYREIFLDSLRYCQKNKGLEICAYCIMTSHIHVIIGRHGEAALEGIILDSFQAQVPPSLTQGQEDLRQLVIYWIYHGFVTYSR